jgi:glycosyltransferase involved in cell wall biosynthesis
LRLGGGLAVGHGLLGALGRVGAEHEYFVALAAGRGYENVCAAIPSCRVSACDAASRLGIWKYRRLQLVRQVREFRPDVVLALGAHNALANPPCPQAVLVDSAQFFYPESSWGPVTTGERWLYRYHIHHLRRSLRHTKLLLAQTELARRRLIQTYDFPAAATALCPNAVLLGSEGPGDAQMPEPLRPHRDKFRLLCLARYMPHKNLEVIPEVFARFGRELPPCAAFLTIAQAQHKRAGGLLRRIARADVAGQVVNVGPVDRAQLGAYFRHCDALLLPTLLESFSGSYLEAMHFGTPILTSDLDFARQICGEAALYFDPHSPSSIRDSIVRLRNDAALHPRLVDLGHQRTSVLSLSWDQIAADLLPRLVGITR